MAKKCPKCFFEHALSEQDRTFWRGWVRGGRGQGHLRPQGRQPLPKALLPAVVRGAGAAPRHPGVEGADAEVLLKKN